MEQNIKDNDKKQFRKDLKESWRVYVYAGGCHQSFKVTKLSVMREAATCKITYTMHKDKNGHPYMLIY